MFLKASSYSRYIRADIDHAWLQMRWSSGGKTMLGITAECIQRLELDWYVEGTYYPGDAELLKILFVTGNALAPLSRAWCWTKATVQ